MAGDFYEGYGKQVKSEIEKQPLVITRSVPVPETRHGLPSADGIARFSRLL